LLAGENILDSLGFLFVWCFWVNSLLNLVACETYFKLRWITVNTRRGSRRTKDGSPESEPEKCKGWHFFVVVFLWFSAVKNYIRVWKGEGSVKIDKREKKWLVFGAHTNVTIWGVIICWLLCAKFC
jgi:hypothetical protein